MLAEGVASVRTTLGAPAVDGAGVWIKFTGLNFLLAGQGLLLLILYLPELFVVVQGVFDGVWQVPIFVIFTGSSTILGGSCAKAGSSRRGSANKHRNVSWTADYSS